MNLALLNLTSGGLSGGYSKYLDHLIPALREDRRIKRLVVYLPPGSNQRKIDGIVYESWPRYDSKFFYPTLRHRLKVQSPDVVFIPSARILNGLRIPTVVMVRNMEPLQAAVAGTPALERIRNIARFITARNACRQASRIIAVSSYVKEYITQQWRVCEDKVGLVYHGVDPAAQTTPSEWASGLGKKIPRKFILTAGSIRPARGLEDILNALSDLVDTGMDLCLVVAGSVDRNTQEYASRLRRRYSRLENAGNLIWVGGIPRNILAHCFERCSIFVMTSRAEACPNIVLEAMSYGCRIISTNQKPMPEFLGDAALYYKGGCWEQLSTHLQNALNNTDYAIAKRKLAKERSGMFRWSDTCDGTVTQLELVRSEGYLS